MSVNISIQRALQYIRNTGETATVAIFDDDHEPVGPMLRADMMLTYAVERDGKLVLTDAGRSALGEGESHG